MKKEILNKVQYYARILRELSLYTFVILIGFTFSITMLYVLNNLYENGFMSEMEAKVLGDLLVYSCNIYQILIILILSSLVISLYYNVVIFRSKELKSFK